MTGAFTIVQEMIDGAGRTYFTMKTPELAKFVFARAINRISDSERLTLFHALHRALGCPTDATHVTETFKNVKALRDQIAHSATFELIDTDTVAVGGEFFQTNATPTEIRAVSREELEHSIHACRWIAQHVKYMLFNTLGSGETDEEATHTLEILKPPARANDWDGQEARVTIH
ncbi:hypothetical protein [Rhodococcus koreensis]